MLWLCLDHLAQARESLDEDVDIRVQVDLREGHAPLSEFAALQDVHQGLDVELRFTAPHRHRGNSFNLLMAYRAALADDNEYERFYLVEDDVVVSPEFYAWHQRVHREVPHVAASVGVTDPGHGAYASLGVCLPRNTLVDILDHAVLAYFRDMRGYCRFAFPPSQFDCEQDGLIARVLAGRTVAWANPPVCSHVGWYGYHRTKTERPTGTLEERYRKVREAVDSGLPGTAADVSIATTPNCGTYTLSTVPGGQP